MLILNVIHAWTQPPRLHFGQTSTWWPLVLNLVEGRGYTFCYPNYFPLCGPTNQVTAMREPAAVLLFAGVAKLAGESLWVAAGVELAINLAIVPGVYLLTRQWTDNRTALLAALIWVVYLPAIKLIPQVSGDLLATLGMAFGMHWFVRAQRTGRARDWLAAGLGLGLAALSRSVILGVALVLAVGLVATWLIAVRVRRPDINPGLRPAVLFSAAVLVTVSPWLVRNYIAFGHPVIGSTLTGYNLFRQTSDLDTENYLRFVGYDEGTESIQALLARRPDLKGTENEAEMDAVYRQEALRMIAAHPFRFTLLTGYRVLELWLNWGIKEAGGAQTDALDYAMMLQQVLLLATAVVGVRAIRPRAWPLAASIAITTAAYMIVNSQMRYIVPVMPLTVSLSVVGCVVLARRWSPSRA